MAFDHDAEISETRLPASLGTVVDIAGGDTNSTWFLLSESGVVSRFDTETWACTTVAESVVTAEPAHAPWDGHVLTPRLHVSRGGRFVAVVHDFGQYGAVWDTLTSRITMALNGGAYHGETVPFSFAFIGENRIIHRTDWNRLDISDAATGNLLTVAPIEADYFHGALAVSPDERFVADDGWEWHPMGVPVVWGLDPPHARTTLCQREGYWNHSMVWLDATRLAIEGIGDDDVAMTPGVRIFEVGPEVRETSTFAGPRGRFFAWDGRLFSVDETGLSVWDVEAGGRIGFVAGFFPTRLHSLTGELVLVVDGCLRRLSVAR